MTDDKNNSDTLSTAQVCEVLGIGRTKLYEIIADKLLTPLPRNPLKKTEKRKYLRADVERLKGGGRPE